ncbi:MAG: hypothetical protein AB7V25_07365 [Mangrovibacterium sp.]
MSLKLMFTVLNFFLISWNFADAQVQIIDQSDRAPIPFVHVISEEGIIIGTSDIEGIIDLREIIEVKTDSVSFQHISYQNKTVSKEKLIRGKKVELTKRNILIPEIVVSSQSQPVYLVLKGFYRSYQIENGVPKYYTDGIVEYYISKNKLKNRVLQHRSFRNKKLEAAEKKRINTVSMVVAGVPYIDAKTSIDALDKDYIISDRSEKRIILKENSEVGAVSYDSQSNMAVVNVDLIAPAKEKENSLFNYTSKITGINIIENYKSPDLINLEKVDLVSRKEYRKIFFKHKKEKDFTEIDGLHEFYVLDKKYLYKSDLKSIDLSSFFGLSRSSEYIDAYWNDLEKYGIEKLPEYIEKLLGTTLTKY